MLIGILVAILIVGVVVVARSGWKPKLPGMPKQTQTAWMTSPWVLAGIGIFLGHLILGIGWPNGYAFVAELRSFWVGHLAFAFFSFTATQSNTAVKMLRKAIVAVWIITVIAETGAEVRNRWETIRTVTSAASTVTPVSISSLSVEVVLPIIAGCESGGRQFDENGNLIVNRSTDDVGKWQINLPTHWARAESLGIDLLAEEGNERFARILYAENGTADWNATRSCWEPQLLALRGRLPATDTVFTIVANKEWTQTYHFPPAMTVEYRAMSPTGRIAMRTQDAIYTFTPEKSDVVPGVVVEAIFMALGESPENIRIRLYQ